MNQELARCGADDLPSIPNKPSLLEIQAFERALKKLPNQVDPEVRHHFAENAYARELLVSAGTVLTGKLHKTQHFLVITRGTIECWTEDGMRVLSAGDIVLTQPGTKRALRAFEDSTMVTFHVSRETDLGLLEAEIIEPEVEAIECEGESA